MTGLLYPPAGILAREKIDLTANAPPVTTTSPGCTPLVI
jgi:hypothetical protein